jgi:hypothetical protein
MSDAMIKVAAGHYRTGGFELVRFGYHTRPRYWRVVYLGREIAKVASKAEGTRWIAKHRGEYENVQATR